MSAHLSLRSPVTQERGTAERADRITLEHLVSLIYDEMRQVAHRQLVRERRLNTLQTTGLVHEAFLKLVDDTTTTERGRAYFFAAAARSMRQILVDRARRRIALKRGGGVAAIRLEEDHASVDAFAAELLDLNEALLELATRSPRQARVVEIRFFSGMSVEETAEILGASPRTVESDWAMARAWLFVRLSGPTGIRMDGVP